MIIDIDSYMRDYGKDYVEMTKETACRVLLYRHLKQDKEEKTEEEKNKSYEIVCFSLMDILERNIPPFYNIAPQWYIDWKEYQNNLDTEVEKS
jgi:hypothetical protein